MGFQVLRVPDEKSEWLRGELTRDERVTWAEEPTPRFLTPETVPEFRFAIATTALALFMTMVAYGDTGGANNAFERVVCLPMLAVGVGLLTRALWARRRMSRAVYAVTDRRALIIDHDVRDTRRVQSFPPAELASIEAALRADGSGDVFFASRATKVKKNGRRVMAKIGFVGVADARAAESALRELVANSS